ncbi:MAG: DUF983 domain-containing protein [Flavisolibacter sp.]
MCATTNDVKPNLLISIFQNKCPRCRRGKLYREQNPYRLKTFMLMHEKCTVCGQPLDMEPGFYYGTNMVSYALAVVFSIISFFVWWVLIGFSLQDKRVFFWLGMNAILLVLLQPPLMRLSRTFWLSFFVPYSSHWMEGDIVAPERVNKDQANNW